MYCLIDNLHDTLPQGDIQHFCHHRPVLFHRRYLIRSEYNRRGFGEVGYWDNGAATIRAVIRIGGNGSITSLATAPYRVCGVFSSVIITSPAAVQRSISVAPSSGNLALYQSTADCETMHGEAGVGI